jgi:hypothetical protein
MEHELAHDDRIDVAHRLYQALCAQYSDRFITLFDPRGRLVARSAPLGTAKAPAAPPAGRPFSMVGGGTSCAE